MTIREYCTFWTVHTLDWIPRYWLRWSRFRCMDLGRRNQPPPVEVDASVLWHREQNGAEIKHVGLVCSMLTMVCSLLRSRLTGPASILCQLDIYIYAMANNCWVKTFGQKTYTNLRKLFVMHKDTTRRIFRRRRSII